MEERAREKQHQQVFSRARQRARPQASPHSAQPLQRRHGKHRPNVHQLCPRMPSQVILPASFSPLPASVPASVPFFLPSIDCALPTPLLSSWAQQFRTRALPLAPLLPHPLGASLRADQGIATNLKLVAAASSSSFVDAAATAKYHFGEERER